MDAIPAADFTRYTLLTPLATDFQMYANFTHLAGYASAYYTYMWDKVISEDFFEQFDQKKPLAGEAPMQLSAGGARSRRIDVSR